MPLDVKSLESGTPTALDGRTYPSHLKRYETFDKVFLPVFRTERHSISFDDLIDRVEDRKARAAAPSWIASASWRGLIEPVQRRSRKPQTWRAGPKLRPTQAA